MEKHNTCIVCNGTALSALKGYEKHYLVSCKSCGLVFSQRIPSATELDTHYAHYSYKTDQEIPDLTKESYHKLLDEFEPYKKNNRLLDVGTGRGWFLQEAKKRGWEVYGTEFSPEAIARCEKNGINMKVGALNQSMFDADFFDVITSFEVIEHINNPNEDLATIFSFLRPKGLFYCTTPNFNSVMRYYLKDKYNVIEYPEHLTYYTKKTLINTVKKAGFAKLKFKTTGISLTRIAQSTNQSTTFIAADSDEKIREKISQKWHYRLMKNAANFILNTTNTGLTLKGYFTKQ